MKPIRNLPIAARLGGAFGVLCLALAIVAFTGMHALSGLREDTDNLGERQLVSAQLLGLMQERAKDNIALIGQHLYVDDGSLAKQDAHLKEIEGNWARSKADGARLDQLFKGTSAEQEFSAWADIRAKVLDIQKQTLEASRAETVRNAEDRSASRTLFEGQLLVLDTEMEKIGAKLEAATTEFAAAGIKDAHHEHASGSRLMLIVAILAILAAIGLAVWVTRSVVRPVRDLNDRMTSLDNHCLNDLATAMDRMAEGDLTFGVTPVTTPIEVKSTDELGRLSSTFNTMLGKAQHSVRGYEAMRAQLSGVISEVAAGAGTVASASQEMAATSDEAGRAVGEIASAVTDVAQGAERQVRMVESTREAVQEAARAATVSAESATVTAEAAKEARSVAEQGVTAAAQATDAIRQVAESSANVGTAMEDLASKSAQIGGIVTTITGLAEQTNLLALNAAIEAARAGEQGKGFAVVAEEVRKLAEESQAAAGQISSLIGEIQAETQNVVGVVAEGGRRTADGVATVEQTREAFEAIGTAVEDVTSRVGEIATAVHQISAEAQRAATDIAEVAAVAEQSSASAEQVSASTQQTSASTQEIAASAQTLASTAETLNGLVGRFKLTV
ncbi:HAMP domain-containing protein [Solirubrobacter sp. CPCC 204708]|uniref:Methyl-accepting chemotaxis protein n=1 Tax=Solirubrobacter deserti TaxID=2282478 RepID=A0ABT4RH60_9ACTN|nr:methyl-accepting chemotaxis protein [Solirubrobacter deserti]MBE2315191.1 HAMP domain-containing protein [Solirubrobacter deserti]MDA0137874.1 methyl-accepting chemotaxis protein [Solirubrobacter deserti]